VAGEAPAHRIWEDETHLAFLSIFPMHGTAGYAGENWREVASPIDGYFDRYQGYLSSHDHHRADDTWLAEIARRVSGTGD
jgi:hypothetical protein